MSVRKWSVRLAWCAAVVSVLGASSAQAQREGRGFGRGGFGFGGGFGGPASLVGREEVQEELKLTDDQKSQIEEVTDSMRDQSRELFAGLRDLSDDERRARMDENREKLQALAAETEQKISGILNADQQKRLNEISLQQRGLRALSDEKVQKDLGLDEQQVATINEAFQKQDEQAREMFQRRDGDGERTREQFAEMREKMEALREETELRVKDALTDEQAAKFEEMKGQPFELRRGGFGGDRPRRGRDENNN